MNNNKAAGRAIVVFSAALFAGLAVSGSALGQQPGGLQVDVGECVKLASPGERLDCYERQVQRAQSAPQAPAATPSPPATPPPAATAPASAPRAAAPAPAAPSAPAERNVRVEEARGGASDSPALTGTIVALREIVPNRWLITLNNGEAWRQTYAERYPLQIGQRVELSRTRGRSSYQLAAIGVNGDIQVEPAR